MILNISLEDTEFLSSFDLLWKTTIDKYEKDRLNLYALKINANEFDYRTLQERLIDPMIDYSISREVKRAYFNRPGTLSKKARTKFKNYLNNEGELGELLLFCFLEAHLKAPKILSKLELKTSTNLYVNGADGVHFLKLENGDYQLIFGEAKMYKDIKNAFNKALNSIYEFKNQINENGEFKSGMQYEKALISDNLSKETFSDDEKKFLKGLIYPNQNQDFQVDDAFGIFVGFEIEVSEAENAMPNATFRKLIHKRIIEEVKRCINTIEKKIKEYNLQGHDFYVYVVPFTDIDNSRKEILKEVIA